LFITNRRGGKDDIEHLQGNALGGQAIAQLGEPGTRPGPVAVGVKTRFVDVDENDAPLDLVARTETPDPVT
jgi:hypothetical protein